MPVAYQVEPPRLAYPADAERSTVPLLACPVKASMGVISKKWTLMIVRDIGYYKLSRYNEFLKNNPGLSERVLSRRLAEMVKEGFLARTEENGDVRYHLAEKGHDVMPILLGFLAFGIKHQAARVFADARPRDLAEAFPQFDSRRVATMLRITP